MKTIYTRDTIPMAYLSTHFVKQFSTNMRSILNEHSPFQRTRVRFIHILRFYYFNPLSMTFIKDHIHKASKGDSVEFVVGLCAHIHSMFPIFVVPNNQSFDFVRLTILDNKCRRTVHTIVHLMLALLNDPIMFVCISSIFSTEFC